MNTKQIRQALDQYTDRWIQQQSPTERGFLRAERRKLESDLAESLAAENRTRKRPTLTLRGSR
jgi:hypothetical protein